MAELIQKKLQGEVEKYQQLQKDLSKSMSGRQKLEAQLTENNIVKEELALLDGSNVVFKLLGPVLVKQELGEARATVGKRLDYITAEIKRYESQLRDLERQSEQQRETLAQLQQEFQRAQNIGAILKSNTARWNSRQTEREGARGPKVLYLTCSPEAGGQGGGSGGGGTRKNHHQVE